MATVALSATATRVTKQAVAAAVALHATGLLIAVSANIRVTQAAIEVIAVPDPRIRVTQAAVEVLARKTTTVRVTQAVVEVLILNTRFIRSIPASSSLKRFAISRTIASIARFSTLTTRTVPAQAYFRRTNSRTIPGTARLGAATFERSIAGTARFRRTNSRSIAATARFRINNRLIPSTLSVRRTDFRAIFALAEIGLRRTIPCQVRLQGTPFRPILSYARFRLPGKIPATASFWYPSPTWRIVSDEQTKVLALASHLAGGSVGSYYGAVPAANNGPLPPNWNLLNYDDTFWPHAVARTGSLVPFPFPDPTIKDIDFDWRWPNETNDYSPPGYISGGDPSFAFNIYRRTFGLPNDPLIVSRTSATVVASAKFGIFIASIKSISVNGHELPFLYDQLNNPSARVTVYDVPSSFLLPGNNIFALETFVYICFGLFGNSTAFEIDFVYSPRSVGLPQVIG